MVHPYCFYFFFHISIITSSKSKIYYIDEVKAMSNIDWKTKLTSRKFWVAVVGFVVPLLVAFGMTDNQAAEVASIIMAGANMIAYIIGEGMVDSSRIKTETKSTITTIKGEATVVKENPDDGK